MRKKVEMAVLKFRKYEEKHPFMPIIITILCMLIIAGSVLGINKYQKYERYSSQTAVDFSDPVFKKEIQKILQKENIYQSDLDMLSDLYINGNTQLSDISDIEKCKNLTQVSITDCAIKEAGILGELNNIQYVDLSNNSIANIDGLEKSNTIKELKLGRNKISDISKICEIETLELLSVSNNNISIIPDDIKKLKNLKDLDISGNRLIDINGVVVLDNLEELNASSNKLTDTPQLEELKQLTTLQLAGNALKNYSPQSEMKNLIKLNLSSNYLDDLDFLDKYPSLIELTISNNQYTSIDGIEKAQSLQTLDIRGTNIKDVSMLAGLPDFSAIYVNDFFDRTQLDFMIGNFKNADKLTKEYLIAQQYKLK